MAFDIITPAKLGQLELAREVLTVYTVPSLTRTILKTIDICNTNSSIVTVTVYLVPNSGSPGVSNTLVPALNVKANSMVQWTGAQVLNEGDTIQALASTTGVTLIISGGEGI